MKFDLLNQIRIDIRKVPKKRKALTQEEVDDAIISLYDEFVSQHGAPNSVYFVATKGQVSKKIGASSTRIMRAIGANVYSWYKEEALVRRGRARFWYSGPDTSYNCHRHRHFVQNPVGVVTLPTADEIAAAG